MKSNKTNLYKSNKEIYLQEYTNQNFGSNNETKYLPQSLLNDINKDDYIEDKIKLPLENRASISTCISNASNISKQRPSNFKKIQENVEISSNHENFDNFVEEFQSWELSSTNTMKSKENLSMNLTKIINYPSPIQKTVSQNNITDYTHNSSNELHYLNNLNNSNYLNNNHFMNNCLENRKMNSINYYNRSSFNFNNMNPNNFHNMSYNNPQVPNVININNLNVITKIDPINNLSNMNNMCNMNNMNNMNNMSYMNNMNIMNNLNYNNDKLYHVNYSTNLCKNKINLVYQDNTDEMIKTPINESFPKRKKTCGDLIEAYNRRNLNLFPINSDLVKLGDLQIERENNKNKSAKIFSSSIVVASVKKNCSENLNCCGGSSNLLNKSSYDNEDDFLILISESDSDILALIKNQKGSRILQKFVTQLSAENLDILLARLSPYLKEIMTDNYANYFMQKLMHCCSGIQRLKILSTISQDLLEISNNASGSHSIQALIEMVTMSEEEEIFKHFIGKNILNLSFNSNGTHIIQKIISCFEESNRVYLNNFILDNIGKICMNVNGICVVKKFISANKDVNIRNVLLTKLEEECIDIVEDPFGNYAIQYAIDIYGVELCKNIFKIIIANIVSLSKQKFSSNVVEKCILLADHNLFNLILNEMFIDPVNFRSIMKNKFGIFVLKKAILRMNPKENSYFKEYLIKNIIFKGEKDKMKFYSILEIFDNNH